MCMGTSRQPGCRSEPTPHECSSVVKHLAGLHKVLSSMSNIPGGKKRRKTLLSSSQKSPEHHHKADFLSVLTTVPNHELISVYKTNNFSKRLTTMKEDSNIL